MAKQVKKIYRILAWLFSVVIAAGTFVGCRPSKYGAPATKYGPPQVTPASKYGPPQVKYGLPSDINSINNNKKGNVTKNEW